VFPDRENPRSSKIILAKALAKHFYKAKAEPGKHQKIKGLENIDKVISIDQSPIGRTPRSNAATYTGVFSHIRDIFCRNRRSQKPRLYGQPVQLQYERRPLRSLPGRGHAEN